jgi:hypothetical protein
MSTGTGITTGIGSCSSIFADIVARIGVGPGIDSASCNSLDIKLV